MRRLVIGLVLAALALGGCSKGNEDPNNPLYEVILNTAPKGYRVVQGPASGPMTIDDASKSTPADPIKKKSFLRRSGYQDGYARIWTRTDNKNDYVESQVYEMAVDTGAADVVNFEIEQIKSKRGTTTFSVPEVVGAKGYILSGSRGGGGGATFCQGIVFSKGSRVFHVFTCSPQPNSPETVKELAKEQDARATKTA